MTVSMHYFDCRTNAATSQQIAEEIAEYERRCGNVQTLPIIQREPDTRVDLVLNARSFEGGKKADGKHNERNAARLSIPVVKPDHSHPITTVMLNHAFRKLAVKKIDVAREIGCSPSHVSNICTGKKTVGDGMMRQILATVWKLAEVRK